MFKTSHILQQLARRGFQQWSPVLRQAEKSVPKPITPSGSASASPTKSYDEQVAEANIHQLSRLQHTVGPWDRRFLVWSGQYKSPDDVPAKVDPAAMNKARNWARIRLNVYLLALAAVGCGIAVYLGKDAWRRGDTLEGRNLEWHRKINEEHRKQMETQKQLELATDPELKNLPDWK